MKLTLLTPTGERPQALNLCDRWMQEQTQFNNTNPDFGLPPHKIIWSEWIVVNDGQEDTGKEHARPIIGKLRPPIEELRPLELWQPGQNTQVKNLRLGLQAIEVSKTNGDCDLIAFIEDDDCYLPHYLENAVKAFMADPKLLVWGERPTKYYNVKHRRFRRLENQTYAILAATVIRREAIPVFLSALDYPNKKGIDHNFWYRVKQGELRNRALLQRAGYDGYQAGVVGIKGMPGRPGIGTGFHEADKSKYWRKDPDLKILTKLVGSERAALYAEFYEPKA